MVQLCPLRSASFRLVPHNTGLQCFRQTIAPRLAGTSSVGRCRYTCATRYQSPQLASAHSVHLHWPASCSSYDKYSHLLVSGKDQPPLKTVDQALAQHSYAQLHKAYTALRAHPDHRLLEHRGFYLVIRLALTAFLHLEGGAATASPVLPSSPRLVPPLPTVAAFIRIVAEDWLSALRSGHDALLDPSNSNCGPAPIHTAYHYLLYALRRSHQRAFALEALRQMLVQGVPTVHLMVASLLQDCCNQDGSIDQAVQMLELYNKTRSKPLPRLLTQAAATLVTDSAHHSRVIQLYEQVRPHLICLKDRDLCSWVRTLSRLQRGDLVKEVYTAYQSAPDAKGFNIFPHLVQFAAQHDPTWIPYLHQDLAKAQWELTPAMTAYLIYGYTRLDRVDRVLELLPWAPTTFQPPLASLELRACLENLLRMGLNVQALALLNAADHRGQPAIPTIYMHLITVAVHHNQPAICLALYQQWLSSSCAGNALVALEMAIALHATRHVVLANDLYRRATSRLTMSGDAVARARIRACLQLNLFDEASAIYQQLSSTSVSNQLRWADTRALVLAATERVDTHLFTTLFQDVLARRFTFTADMYAILGNGCLELRCLTLLDTLVDQLVSVHPRLVPSVVVEWVGQALTQQQPVQTEMLGKVFIQHAADATIDQCHALLAAFLAHRGDVAIMQQLVATMETPGSRAPLPTATTWALFVRALHQAGSDAKVVQVFGACFPRHRIVDTLALAAAMCSLVRTGHPIEATYIWEWVERHKYQWHPLALAKLLDAIAPTTYRAFTQALYHQGLAQLTATAAAGISSPDITQLATSLVRASLTMQARADFLMLWSTIAQSPLLQPDTQLLSVLLEACRELNVQQSHKILAWAQCNQIQLDVPAYRSLVQLYCQRNQFIEAVDVVDTLMPTAGLRPDRSIVQGLAAQLILAPSADCSRRRLKMYAQVCGAPVTDWVAGILK
ncbi:hypothetical protein H4R34_002816 [Dimargaris verticillata]|uniref:Pentacotripeptide-repeat region of PRORP domain-containing protein n=1 Tax=Dimargaris verticillata TaxID=2761393 RepID=A0A9W8ECK4_9FUNG|nr:hypothetical protein H4R34_002816 [Dimargaris verticillata]